MFCPTSSFDIVHLPSKQLTCLFCREEKDALQSQLTSVRAQLDQFGEARAAHVDALRMEIAAADQRHDDKMTAVEQQVSSLQQQLTVEKTSKADAKKQLEAVEEQLQVTRSSQALSQARAEGIQQQITSLQEQISNEKTGKDGALQQISGLQEQLQSSQSSQASTQARAEQAGQQMAQASAEHDQAIRTQESELKQQAQAAREEAANSRQDADGVRSVTNLLRLSIPWRSYTFLSRDTRAY